MQPPRKPWHPTACHKVEAVCQHFLSVASDERPRQKLLRAAISGMAMGKSKTVLKNIIGGFAFAHRHLFYIFFFTARQKFLSRPSRSDVFDYIFFPAGPRPKPHTNKKCLHGLMAALSPAGGKRWRPCPFFSARLFPRRLPPHPRTPARARAYARVG